MCQMWVLGIRVAQDDVLVPTPGAPRLMGERKRRRDDCKYNGNGCDRSEPRLRTRCSQHLGIIVLSTLDGAHGGSLHTLAVYTSLPLLTQFPLPGMLSLCLPGKVQITLQIPAHITLPRKRSPPTPTPHPAHPVLLCAICSLHYRDMYSCPLYPVL